MSADGVASRAAIVATAGETIARGSRSFAMASRLFASAVRERAWLLYAWCRACDDLADGQQLGHGMTVLADAPERVAAIRALTARALAGEPVAHPAFDALRYLAAERPLPPEWIEAVIAGFQLDADDWRPRTEDDLMRYCWHVAGAVGCLMAVVMGVDPTDEDTIDRAADLGLAFQLANIARDIEEDDRVGRCYLPVEWLVEMDIPPGEHMKPPFRPRLAVLARRMADLAQRHEASAHEGAMRLPLRSRWAVLAAAGIYGEIARKVAARGEHAWDHRVTVGRAHKLALVGRTLGAALNRRTPAPRDPTLWTRPRLPLTDG